jgi:hypothetical protein
MQCAVGAMVVEIGHVLGQGVFEVAAVDDQHPVQQLAADGADPSFGDRVRPGRLHGGAQDADALAGEHGIETLVNFGVAILDQEREVRHAIAEVHQQIPRLLSNPGPAGVRRDAQQVDAAGGMLHTEQHVKPVTQQSVDAEEVVARMPWAWAARN